MNIPKKKLVVSSSETVGHVKIIVRPSTSTGIFKSPDIEVESSVFDVPKTSNTCTTSLIPDFKICLKQFKIIVLLFIWAVCSICLMIHNETVAQKHQISIQKDTINSYIIRKRPTQEKLKVVLEGAFLPNYYKNLTTKWMEVWVQLMVIKEKPVDEEPIKSSNILLIQNVSDVWYVPLAPRPLLGFVPDVEQHNIYNLTAYKVDNTSFNLFRMQFKTNLDKNLPILMDYDLHPINPDDGIIYAAILLVGLYILIIFDIVHRTLAAMLASTVSVAILAVLNSRPSMSEIMTWIDSETLLLLFSMMTLVTIFSESGVFDFLAVWAYKFTGGKLWPLINILCIIVTVLSSVLDNVTTALLITPVTIKLCEVMAVNPVPILMATLIFANIAGAITPIGDPPNVIIASNPDVIKSGIHFGVFTLHMGVGSVICLLIVYIQLRIVYRKPGFFYFPGSIKVEDLKREIAVWKRTAASVSNYSKDEDIVKESLIKKSEKLQGKLKVTLSNHSGSDEEKQKSKNHLESFENQHSIKDKVLLLKSGIALLLVVIVLFLHSIPALSRLGMGWTSLLGVILLLLLCDNDHLESVFTRVEWTTLLFFAALFILMEALAKLGLIEYIGQGTHCLIASVDPSYRLTAAVILILWVSAVASAFVDNLPLTTMMVRVATELSAKSSLPLQPLIWALSFGACLGGNGSLFGSSANIVCAGVAEQHGYKFSFTDFMKMGVPVTITSLLIATTYLIICHVVLEWH